MPRFTRLPRSTSTPAAAYAFLVLLMKSADGVKQLRVLVVSDEQVRAGLASLHDELVHARIDGHRVVAGETRETEALLGLSSGAHHGRHLEVAERIGAKIFADFFVRELVGEEFLGIGEIDAVMAGVAMRRTGNAHVHFLRAGFTQVDHAGLRG